MRITIHKNLRDAQVIEATRVVIEDIKGNPVMIALEYAPGMIVAAHPGDPDFNNLLKNLGIDKVVVCTDVEEPRLDMVRFDGQQGR